MRKKGVTFVEILVSICILSCVSLALISSYCLGFTAFKKAKVITITSWLAQEKIQEVLSCQFIEEIEPLEGNFPHPFSRYWFSISILDDREIPSFKKVILEVKGIIGSKIEKVTLITFKNFQ